MGLKKSCYFYPKENQLKCGAILNSIIKNDSWKFEKEWRLIRYVNDESKQYFNWKMTEIYLGCDISSEAISSIKNIIEKNDLNIGLKQMQLSVSGLEAVDL